ncbi:HAD family hydrolase [Coraliomargarita sp. SDUM461004]|uniref:phosphoglycolate phosphatase n=1 Tax=Thalassobacterium sedimentorum TaxID=3041258 RepID=A0ABU1ALC8_9BACT|nr:HAD family hydrolase [Coraliomargarita sp. SDUM461004]MDQ8195554.1 HAD family hydrolase [Coraliomargarita sp. SDUM461004]
MNLLLDNVWRPIDLVVFDCDGVLLETMAAKIEAFQRWVPTAHTARGAEFMQVVMAGFGKARAHHIRSFYEDILNQVVSQEFLDAEVERFTAICEPLCAGADWRVGAREFVLACRDASLPRFVLSGTPQAPLEAMLVSTGAIDYFDVVIGSPPAKSESLRRILSETEVLPDRCVFIGDAEADRAAAASVDVHFVYFPSEADRPEGPIATEVSDLRQLLPVAEG